MNCSCPIHEDILLTTNTHSKQRDIWDIRAEMADGQMVRDQAIEDALENFSALLVAREQVHTCAYASIVNHFANGTGMPSNRNSQHFL
jgi:hypothetical protein